MLLCENSKSLQTVCLAFLAHKKFTSIFMNDGTSSFGEAVYSPAPTEVFNVVQQFRTEVLEMNIYNANIAFCSLEHLLAG